jgi:hypothetical protein
VEFGQKNMVKPGRTALLPPVLALLLSGCPVPVAMNVANSNVRGHVVDASTGLPVANALIVQTIGRGGFWSTPSTYDLGSALSEADGSFLIPAAPQRLMNVSDSDEGPLLGIFAEGYSTTWFARDKSSASEVEIRLTQLPLGRALYDPCKPVPYTGQTCQRIREHLRLGGNGS